MRTLNVIWSDQYYIWCPANKFSLNYPCCCTLYGIGTLNNQLILSIYLDHPDSVFSFQKIWTLVTKQLHLVWSYFGKDPWYGKWKTTRYSCRISSITEPRSTLQYYVLLYITLTSERILTMTRQSIISEQAPDVIFDFGSFLKDIQILFPQCYNLLTLREAYLWGRYL